MVTADGPKALGAGPKPWSSLREGLRHARKGLRHAPDALARFDGPFTLGLSLQRGRKAGLSFEKGGFALLEARRSPPAGRVSPRCATLLVSRSWPSSERQAASGGRRRASRAWRKPSTNGATVHDRGEATDPGRQSVSRRPCGRARPLAAWPTGRANCGTARQRTQRVRRALELHTIPDRASRQAVADGRALARKPASLTFSPGRPSHAGRRRAPSSRQRTRGS